MISHPVPFPLRLIIPPAREGDEATCECGIEKCSRVGKHPAILWRDLKYGDPLTAPAPGAGVGLKTGAAPFGSDIIVVDLDGEEAIDAWNELGGFNNNTRIVQTGRAEGGLQLYFQHPGFPVKNSASVLAPKIDIRGDGGFVVMEGSPHRSGLKYELVTDDNIPPAPAPAWLVEWLRKQPAPREAQVYAGDIDDEVELEWRRTLYANYLKGPDVPICGEANRGRNDTLLFDVVQRGAYDMELPTEDVLELMREHYDPRCEPPWGDELEERVYHKAHTAKTASQRPRIEPPPSPTKDPMLAELFAPSGLSLDTSGTLGGAVSDPRELDIARIEAARPMNSYDGAADGLGFSFGGWDEEPPPIDFIVEGLIPVGSVGMFYGEADSLKTWLLYSLAIAVARGEPWLGHAVKAGMRVAIVDYETGKVNLRRRLFMLRAGRLVSLGSVSMPRGDKPNAAGFWVKLAKDDCHLTIIDSLRKANPGANENDSEEAILPLNLAADYAEITNYAVIFIHHSKKAADGDGWPALRGSQAIIDQCDYTYAVRQVGEKGGDAEAKRIEIKNMKPGDMRQPPPFALDVQFDDALRLATIALAPPDEPGAGGVDDEPLMTDEQIQSRIRLFLSAGPCLTKEKIRKAVGGRRERVYEELAAMIKGGEIIEIDDYGFDLESPERRRERVFRQVRTFDRWSSPAKLAAAAQVKTAFVEAMIREGYLAPRASGGGAGVGGFIVVDRSN